MAYGLGGWQSADAGNPKLPWTERKVLDYLVCPGNPGFPWLAIHGGMAFMGKQGYTITPV